MYRDLTSYPLKNLEIENKEPFWNKWLVSPVIEQILLKSKNKFSLFKG
jgi:hypothetical protein